jgi:hypothetical protein
MVESVLSVVRSAIKSALAKGSRISTGMVRMVVFRSEWSYIWKNATTDYTLLVSFWMFPLL